MAEGLIFLVHEALEGVEVPFVFGDESAGVTSLMVHWWHLNPFIIFYVKFFTVLDHVLLMVAPANHIYEPIFKIIMGRE